MNCTFCDTNKIKETTTNYERNIKGVKYIIRNVPALFCETCGDYYFDDKIVKFIKNEFIKKENNQEDKFVRITNYEDLKNM
ncbi:type II toxin-antitoxin system MqsA family antitoxin [Clostridium magnum]|uniref:YgiT-type zinc finger domain protein n=1 Tax=Clostridium magnum DSM 2767 TaxID=1121326 RepID=A0A161WCL7_9CLOT|nr:type II toxin-antitoxin system MqsA family antitoxin [Clostridium magnum]KZL89415.1 hypothetical protein CLMAG_53190 [Clostridium magnum DSM 2767]SHI20522.1 YgiT-type zinc finger domain-containing protein [Clostridium magnum DSM 2767]